MPKKNKPAPVEIDPAQNERTQHGDNLCDEIQGPDAYGAEEPLTAADLWAIADNLHTHFMDTGNKPLEAMAVLWMRQVEEKFPDIERQ